MKGLLSQRLKAIASDEIALSRNGTSSVRDLHSLTGKEERPRKRKPLFLFFSPTERF